MHRAERANRDRTLSLAAQ